MTREDWINRHAQQMINAWFAGEHLLADEQTVLDLVLADLESPEPEPGVGEYEALRRAGILYGAFLIRRHLQLPEWTGNGIAPRPGLRTGRKPQRR